VPYRGCLLPTYATFTYICNLFTHRPSVDDELMTREARRGLTPIYASIPPTINLEGAMGTFRMYAGPDQQAHIEQIDLKTKPDWLKGLPASQITFREWPAGQFLDWHPAPRRQFVIILSGQLEIGFSDGTSRVFGPGDARLVEDTTGKGHTTRVHGNQPCMTATIPLAQQ
jgi:hypothetical protein